MTSFGVKLKILLTADPELPVPPPLYGGIERIVSVLASGLMIRGHDIALAANAQSDPNAGWELFPWPGERSQQRWDMLANALALRKAIRSFRPDVVHSFSRLFYLAAALPRRLPKIMSYQRKPSIKTVSRAVRLAGNSILFTGCSDSITRQGAQAGGKWKTIHNFVDVERYTFQRNVDANAPLIFLSRIESIKGPDLAIEAARGAGRKLILAGNHSEKDDDEGRYWREKIRPSIDGDRVQYVGPVDDTKKNELLGRAAALMVPIQWDEPFGIVFVEALACGTPVITCSRGALPEIVRNGIDGYFADTTNERVEAVRRLPEISRANCRSRVESCFSASVIVPKYEALYHEMCTRGTHTPTS